MDDVADQSRPDGAVHPLLCCLPKCRIERPLPLAGYSLSAGTCLWREHECESLADYDPEAHYNEVIGMTRFAYPIAMLASLIVFALVRSWQKDSQVLQSIPQRARIGIALAAFCGSMLGSKLPDALGIVDGKPSGLFADGKSVTTGLLGGYLAVEIVKRWFGISTKTGDSFALPLAASMAVGRLGCFFHGCCHGIATTLPWGMNFGDGILRHPTQLYESLFHLSCAMALMAARRLPQLKTHKLQAYLLAYCVFRFATEFIRPARVWWMGMTWYQLVVTVMAVMLTVQWRHEFRKC